MLNPTYSVNHTHKVDSSVDVNMEEAQHDTQCLAMPWSS